MGKGPGDSPVSGRGAGRLRAGGTAEADPGFLSGAHFTLGFL